MFQDELSNLSLEKEEKKGKGRKKGGGKGSKNKKNEDLVAESEEEEEEEMEVEEEDEAKEDVSFFTVVLFFIILSGNFNDLHCLNDCIVCKYLFLALILQRF